MKVIGYTRVSTNNQDLKRQKDLIKDYMDISVLEHNLYYTFDFDYGIAHDE